MRALAGMLSAMALALAITAPANAATFKPTRFDDPAPDKCKPDNCSLREAISAAREDTGTKDKVVLEKGRYVIERPDDATDDNDDGDFDVLGPTTIVGKGKKTVVDGNGVEEVFTLLGFDKRSIKNLTITGGVSTDGGGGVSIGPSKATLSKVVIKGNTAEDGAGIRSVSPDLKIKKSTITGNTATSGPGGGIYIPIGLVAEPKLTIRDSTISGNSAVNGGGMMFGSAGTGDDPSGDIVNSTFAENEATVDGGGIAAIEGADLQVANSSIGENRANSDEAVSGRGGGIFQSTGAFFELSNSILASNSAGIPGGQEFGCAGSFAGAGNVVTVGPGCTSFDGPSNTITSSDIAKPLANNGGPTKTLALTANSDANGSVEFGCPKRDQRGESRPDSDCDAGSYERNPK